MLLVLPAGPLRNICVLSSSAAGSELTSITTASFFRSHPPRISGEDGAETGDTKEKRRKSDQKKKRGREWGSLTRFGTALWEGGVQERGGKHE